MAIREIKTNIPADKAFITSDGKDEMCHATGREGLINGFWWYEFVDSRGELHYGR